MNLSVAVEIMSASRELILRSVSTLSTDALLRIPDGASNNVLWNMGHIAVTQQLLHYRLSDVDLRVTPEDVARFAKGSSPADWEAPPDAERVKHLLESLPIQFGKDLDAGLFKQFKGYVTSRGLPLTSLAHAVAFNTFHEGMHAGVIQEMVKRFS